MDPFTMADVLIGDLQLTSSQVAQLRAINMKYYTELYALQQRAVRQAVEGPSTGRRAEIAEAHLRALDARIARDIRDILTEEQQTVFDRNWPRLGL